MENRISEKGKVTMTIGQIRDLIRESDGGSAIKVIEEKKNLIRKAKVRIEELFNIVGMTLDEIEQVEKEIDSGNIDGSKDDKGWLKTPEDMVEVLTSIRSSVVDISAVKSELNDALMNLCGGFRMNHHGGIVRGRNGH